MLTSCATPAASSPMDDSLSACDELRFELDALGDVVDDDQPADHMELAVTSGAIAMLTVRGFASRGRQPELVQVVNAGILANAIELLDKRGREHFTQGTRQRLPAWQRIHHFHLRVPGLHAVCKVNRHYADVDRFYDVFVEVFQALVLGDLLLQGGI